MAIVETTISYDVAGLGATFAIMVDSVPTTEYVLATGVVTLSPLLTVQVLDVPSWRGFLIDLGLFIIAVEKRITIAMTGPGLSNGRIKRTATKVIAIYDSAVSPFFDAELVGATGVLTQQPRGVIVLTWREFKDWYEFLQRA